MTPQTQQDLPHARPPVPGAPGFTVLTPDDLQRMVEAGDGIAPSSMDAAYAASVLTWVRQTYEGRMDYSAVTTSTVQDLLGREPIHLDAWATAHRQELLDQLP
jgi:NAD(P)H dehydrogenase (quinone)